MLNESNISGDVDKDWLLYLNCLKNGESVYILVETGASNSFAP